MLEAILGWVGTVGSLVAYTLLVRGRLAPRSQLYLGMNAAAATLAGTASVIYGAWPSAASNFVWVIMSVYPAIADMRRRAVGRRKVIEIADADIDRALPATVPIPVMGGAAA
ncbi:CBU_0592 family membrane protein [Microbacterium sp. A196]|uniref:CBU_0592 family membrane protein n=1 Tax=Microbacterium sp. A196 TaxID=3457320 RepID=UPI003FD2344E